MIVNVDAKSLEWTTYLFLSQDKVGIDEWEAVIADPTKHDIHTANQQAFRLPSRLVAKVFLFRWIYRGSAYAYSMDPDFRPVSSSVDFWQNVIDAYYAKYKEIYKTHLRYIKTATQTGKLISPFGREYIFTQHKKKNGDMQWSENDITNWPNQGCGADVMAVARIFARQRMKKAGLSSLLISTVHDSIVADCPNHEVEQVSEIFYQVFLDLPKLITASYRVEWNIPMLGEVSVGNNMYDLKELDFSK